MEKQKEIQLTSKWLTEQNACESTQRTFKRFFKRGSITFTKALKKLQRLANTKPKLAEEYVRHAEWLISRAPQNKKRLILYKPPKGYFFL